MTEQDNLLDKYYRGETTIGEERELKNLILSNNEFVSEKVVFNYFESEASTPDGLEDDMIAGIENKVLKRKTFRMKLYSAISAAAVVLVLLTVYLDFRNTKRTQMADNFFVMEQALFQISESLQPPQEQEEMLILWVDDDVEIIIN